MDKPVLYSFRRCPYAMRARLVLGASGVACELREVVLRDIPAHMLELSPKGTVPVLWLPDGTVIDESRDIMFWALAQNDRHHWLAQFAARDDDVLLALFDGDFKYHLDRYKYASRYDTDAIAHRTAAHNILGKLEPILTHHWLAGDTPGLIDCAILPFVRQFRIADTRWFDNALALPQTQNWLARFLDWSLFHAIMEKYPRWQPHQTAPVFAPVA